jgi:hypothetical protein
LSSAPPNGAVFGLVRDYKHVTPNGVKIEVTSFDIQGEVNRRSTVNEETQVS